VLEPNPTRAARQQAYALRARTRWLTPSQRERGCGYWPVTEREDDPYIEVRRDGGKSHARWCGLLQCGHIWTCPVCSQQKRAKRAALFDAAIRGLGGRWQMLTVTLRHRNGMPLERLLTGLSKAWRRCRQGGRVQRIWSERVTASARATEIPHGTNGWHTHLHVVLRTSEWDDSERQALLSAYQSAIRTELGAACLPDDLHGLFWSEPFDGSNDSERGLYLSKLAFEVAGFGKEGKLGSVSSWEVARRAGEGDQSAMRLWSEFYTATKGRRMFELDERAAAAGREQQLTDELEKTKNADPQEGDVPHSVLFVRTRDFQRLRTLERKGLPAILAQVLRSAETDGQAGIDKWLTFANERAGPPCNRREAPWESTSSTSKAFSTPLSSPLLTSPSYTRSLQGNLPI
jgi:hypothetical protein